MFRWWLSGRMLVYQLHFCIDGSSDGPDGLNPATRSPGIPAPYEDTFQSHNIRSRTLITLRTGWFCVESRRFSETRGMNLVILEATLTWVNLTSGALHLMIPSRDSDDASHSFRYMATTRNKSPLLLLCEVLLVIPQNSVEENTTKIGIAKYIVILYM
jgi:hypothetical protein